MAVGIIMPPFCAEQGRNATIFCTIQPSIALHFVGPFVLMERSVKEAYPLGFEPPYRAVRALAHLNNPPADMRRQSLLPHEG